MSQLHTLHYNRKKALARGGFTLIEVILGIVLAGVLGTIVVQFMNVTLPRSHRPVDWVHQESEVGTVLETITAAYTQSVNSAAIDGNYLTTFYNSIQTGGNPSVDKSMVCFKSDGTMAPAGTCAANTVNLVRIDVTATDGRRYTTLFAMTRNATDPTRTH